MPSRTAIVSVTAALLLWLSAPLVGAAEPDETPTWQWDEVPRVVAVGDIHGKLDKLRLILRATGIADEDLSWTGGQSHFVFCGDLIDRGPADRAVLDLARRLQQEAAAQGGRVHVILGNHELMNVVGDFRYVSPESFEEFAADENERDRSRAFGKFRRTHRGTQAEERAAFDEQFPPGYFARAAAFALDGEYGSWLLQQPAIIKINGVAFVHGGLTPAFAGLGLQGINGEARATAVKWIGSHAKQERSSPYELLPDTIPFSPTGPLWYRGNSLDNERLGRVPLTEALELIDARALVVGHTPTKSERITSRFNGKLYRADVSMGYDGEPQALVIEDNEFWTFDATSFMRSTPLIEPPQGEKWPPIQEELPDERLETFLLQAVVLDSEEIRRGDRRVKIVELRGGIHVRALFQFVEEKGKRGASADGSNPRRYQHEVAAYRIDRLLGLRMVPVSVLRKVDSKRGSISLWYESAIDLPYIQSYGRWDLLRGLEPEINRARVFSALIGARERADAAKMIVPPQRRIQIADNSKAFPLSTAVDDLLVLEVEGFDIRPCDMGAGLEVALQSLDPADLQPLVGDLLSAKQIESLLTRRDRILEFCDLQEGSTAEEER